MAAERVKLMRIGRGDERLVVFPRHFPSAAIQIEKAFMKVTKLNRVKTIDFLEQPFANRAAEDVKRMRREREYR